VVAVVGGAGADGEVAEGGHCCLLVRRPQPALQSRSRGDKKGATWPETAGVCVSSWRVVWAIKCCGEPIGLVAHHHRAQGFLCLEG